MTALLECGWKRGELLEEDCILCRKGGSELLVRQGMQQERMARNLANATALFLEQPWCGVANGDHARVNGKGELSMQRQLTQQSNVAHPVARLTHETG